MEKSVQSISSKSSNLHSNYVTGLIQASGGFGIRTKYFKKTGNIYIKPYLNLSLHSDYINIVKEVNNFFDAGYFRIDARSICRYECSNLEQLYAKILPHFDKYQLCPLKYNSYLLFRFIVLELYLNKSLSKDIKLNLINLGYNMNFFKKDQELFRYLNTTELSLIKSRR
jgi:hypothetical protein